jgi:hypothetical protein
MNGVMAPVEVLQILSSVGEFRAMSVDIRAETEFSSIPEPHAA